MPAPTLATDHGNMETHGQERLGADPALEADEYSVVRDMLERVRRGDAGRNDHERGTISVKQSLRRPGRGSRFVHEKYSRSADRATALLTFNLQRRRAEIARSKVEDLDF